MPRKRVERPPVKKEPTRKPVNIHRLDVDVMSRVRKAVTTLNTTVSGYVERALIEKLERDGF